MCPVLPWMGMDPLRFRSILTWTQVRLGSTEIYGVYNVKIVSRACEALGQGGIESCTLVSNQNSLFTNTPCIHNIYASTAPYSVTTVRW